MSRDELRLSLAKIICQSVPLAVVSPARVTSYANKYSVEKMKSPDMLKMHCLV